MADVRLLVLSDLHQGDGGKPFDPEGIDVPFDIVVVAGDCAGRLTSSIQWLAGHFAGTRVVYVAGNHDYYRSHQRDGFTIEEETEAGLELADRRGIDLLVDAAVEIQGVRFLGSTLWTDLKAGIHHGLPQAIGDARRGMNDYKRIHRRSTARRSRRIDPSFTRELHFASRRFLSDACSSGCSARTVVVTHHAPSMASLPDSTADLSQCYATDLEAEILRWNPALWVHGHVHAARDYGIGRTRVVCNPLGRIGETTGFRADVVIVVSA